MNQPSGGVAGRLGWPVVGAAVLLLVAPVLPWVTVTARPPSGMTANAFPSYAVSGLGGAYVVWGVLALMCALAAGALGLTGAITRNGWVTGAAAVPGIAALVVAGLTAVQLAVTKPTYAPPGLTRTLPPLALAYLRARAEAFPAYGWYIALLAALLLLGLGATAFILTVTRRR
ncbi:MAG TPA: hypothetical protein VGL93_30610 [Streptosporangiaceae bacterium]|jgi:hypothetical protein